MTGEPGIEIRALPQDRLAELSAPIGVAFGMDFNAERQVRFRTPELSLRLGAYEGERVVGASGSFTFELTVPGGVAVETAGLTLVGVLPTHRRRGVLRAMMRHHLDHAHQRRQALAALFSSEPPIYGRYGYGIASLAADIEIARERTAFARAGTTAGRTRLLAEEEAVAPFAEIWDRVRLTRPGMLSRSTEWWRTRRTLDPLWLRGSRGPLQRMLLEIDGRPAAYALYRFSAPFAPRQHQLALDVVEAVGDSPEATRAIWRQLFDIDLMEKIQAIQLPIDHPLLFLLADPRRLHLRVTDGLWVRLVDVAAALSARRLGEAPPIVIEVGDAFCPWNSGRYRVSSRGAERTPAEPDLALDVEALGSAYLGAFSLTQLALAGRAVERTPGALQRADALFRADCSPWTPEIF